MRYRDGDCHSNFISGDWINWVTQISAGYFSCYALKSDGTVWAWGRNVNGELGNGSTGSYSATPVQVTGLTGITQVSGKFRFALALKNDGTVWAWGTNWAGQLGNGTTNDSNTPVQVSNLTGVVQISAGARSGYARLTDGTVMSWGYNADGELGNGTTTNSMTPVQVIGLTGVSSISGGEGHVLALLSNGALKAWGFNGVGNLGNGSWYDSSTPVDVTSLSTAGSVIAYSAGYGGSYAVKTDGTCVSWGYNDYGKLGNGDIDTYTTVPTAILNLTGITQISGGYQHAAVLKSDGTVWSFGRNNYGQLGSYVGDYSLTPVQIQIGLVDTTPPTAPTSLASSSATASTATLTWTASTDDVGVTGYDIYRNGTEVGSSTTTTYTDTGLTAGTTYSYTVKAKDAANNESDASNTASVTTSAASAGVTQVSAGIYITAVLKSDGTVWMWGKNEFDQCCTGTATATETLTQVPGLTDVVQISTGWAFTMALKSDGTVWTWGRNVNGELGIGDTYDYSTEAVQVTGLTGVQQVSAGSVHALALKTDGTVWSWGYNGFGQLGNGTTNASSSPVQVSGLTGVSYIAAGDASSYAVKSDGTAWSWGHNDSGQLGDGTIVDKTTPVQVSNLTGVSKISAGVHHALALLTNGGLYAWGSNDNVQLGNGSTTDSSIPVGVTGLSAAGSVTSISAGAYHSLAIKADGTAAAWGSGDCGVLGDGTGNWQNIPVSVLNLTNVVQIDGGSAHTIALLSDGTVWSWGDNRYGLVPGTAEQFPNVPVQSQTSLGSLSFVDDGYMVGIPENGTNTVSVSASGTDENGNSIDPDDITYSLETTYTGVTIDSSTGVITVTPDATDGSVHIVASVGALSCTTTLYVGSVGSTELTLSTVAGNTYLVCSTASNISSFNGMTFTVTYDAAALQITDLCALTFTKETTAGAISGTGITITSFTPGAIQFTVDKTIPTGSHWSGVMNIIEFVALATGDAVINVQ